MINGMVYLQVALANVRRPSRTVLELKIDSQDPGNALGVVHVSRPLRGNVLPVIEKVIAGKVDIPVLPKDLSPH